MCVCFPEGWYCPGVSHTNLGVFDLLCHFALLKRGCANSGGFGARCLQFIREWSSGVSEGSLRGVQVGSNVEKAHFAA